VSYSILIIDDEKNVRVALGNLLKDYGYKIFLAERLVEAEKILLTEEISLIMLDLFLNQEDGLKWLKKMSSMKKYYPTTIIISGNVNPETLEKGMEIGVVGVLKKPFASEEVINIIREALEKRSSKINILSSSGVKRNNEDITL